MQRKNIKSVLESIRKGSFSASDENIGKYWLHQLNQQEQSGYSDEKLEKVSGQMWHVLELELKKQGLKVRSIWPRILTIAASVAVIAFSIYIWGYFENRKQNLNIQSSGILPGEPGATLTLANGKKIRLNDLSIGEIAKEPGIKIVKEVNGQLVYTIEDAGPQVAGSNALSTANGESYTLILPDKSKVWLNAASKLTYSVSLNHDAIRKVKLEGEAFFEVAKDKKHPFVVQTGTQEIEVLGTQFNINSYNNEPNISTTLIEGSVLVRDFNQKQKIVPGEQLLNNGKGFKVVKVDTESVVDWKNGEFNLDGEPLKRAMRKIARWYNIEVVFDPSLPDDMITGGWISRKSSLSTILEGIEESKQVHFKLVGRKLYVSK